MTNINQAVELKENDNLDLPILPISESFSSSNLNEWIDTLSPQPTPKLQKSKILQAVL